MAGNLTLALIKPHAVFEKNVGKIISRMEDEGFAILLMANKQLRREGAEDFYKEHKGKDFFDNLTQVMCSGPIVAVVLAKDNAVEEWRNVIGATDSSQAGPSTIRGQFGNKNNVALNAVHGSATDFEAIREINFFFGRELKVASRVLGLEQNEG